MSAGATVDKRSVDDRVSNISTALNQQFDAIRQFAIYLAAQTDPMLTALGYNAGDIALLRSSTLDLENLRKVYEGLATVTGGVVTVQAGGYDFRTFVKLLWGFGF